MPTTIELEVIPIDAGWQVTRPDGYRLLLMHLDRTRPGTCRAETAAYCGEDHLLTATIDLLNLRDRETFHLAASGVNGKTPVSWDQFLERAYIAITKTTTAAASAVSVWNQATTAKAFCAQEDATIDATVKDFLVLGCITFVAAPRGSGKSFVALFLAVALAQGGIFRMERLAHQRVLLVDRDNPQALIRRRLRDVGADKLTTLKVLTRETAPPPDR